MTCQLLALGFDAHDPALLAQFWGEVLGREVVEDATGAVALRPGEGPGFLIRFLPTSEPRTRPNHMHFDLASEEPADQQRTVENALRLGGRHLDIGQGPDADHVVLADPEGNEFCVIPAGNNFLAGCGRLGALSSDGSQAVGRFWSAALGWPLVWDQDEETAIQSPRGGPKISWGGPPVAPKTGKNRLHLDVTPAAEGEQQLEVGRLVDLGATRSEHVQCEADWVAMVDPDGNEFCVMTSRASRGSPVWSGLSASSRWSSPTP